MPTSEITTPGKPTPDDPHGSERALGYRFHIASSGEQAIRESAPDYEENMKMFGELRLVRALPLPCDLRDPLGTPPDVQLADLDRFAKEVIPAFRAPEPPPPRSRPEAQPPRRHSGV